jgi:hypothetical protein
MKKRKKTSNDLIGRMKSFFKFSETSGTGTSGDYITRAPILEYYFARNDSKSAQSQKSAAFRISIADNHNVETPTLTQSLPTAPVT